MLPDIETRKEKRQKKKEKGNEGGQCPQSQIKASPSLLPRLSKPLLGSRGVSRYSCLSVSSFRNRERARERQSERERQREGKRDNAIALSRLSGLGFHGWTREKQQQQQVQLNEGTLVVWLPGAVF